MSTGAIAVFTIVGLIATAAFVTLGLCYLRRRAGKQTKGGAGSHRFSRMLQSSDNLPDFYEGASTVTRFPFPTTSVSTSTTSLSMPPDVSQVNPNLIHPLPAGAGNVNPHTYSNNSVPTPKSTVKRVPVPSETTEFNPYLLHYHPEAQTSHAANAPIHHIDSPCLADGDPLSSSPTSSASNKTASADNTSNQSSRFVLHTDEDSHGGVVELPP
jgi:hypothetical protein